MSRISRMLVVLLLALPTPALAQVQTGSILVKATDEQGAVMPGVAVTISSPALVAGTMTGVTDIGGVYRFPSLPPGMYSVKLDLQGFQTVVRDGVAVLVGQTTPIDLTLKVASVAETITVSGASPTVDTTSANVNVNLSEQLLQGTPGGRDIWGLIEYKVPSLVMSRPDVGGTQGGLQGTYSARGTTSGQNSQFLNGINVGDPAAIGAAGYYYDYDAFEDIQVSTGAHDISVPTSGVFLNMATKSGGDRWGGRSTFTWTGKGTEPTNIDSSLTKYGFRPAGNKTDFVSDVNVSAGGPIVQKKLRLFGSFRDWRVHVNVPVASALSVLDQTNITSGLGNLTWQVNQNNKITGFYSRQRYSKPNRLLNTASITVPDSTVDEEDKFDVYQALWNSVISRNFFVDARLGLNKILFPTYFNGGNQQSLTDNATGIIYGNNPSEVIRHRDRYQANATGQYYLDQALGGRHEFKFGFDTTHAVTKNETHRVDQVQAFYDSTKTPRSQTVNIYATPLIDISALNVTALFAQDSYSVKRLTLIGGIRWERLEGYLPAQSSPPSLYFPDIPRSFPEVRSVVLWHTAGPRVSAVYDVNGDGRTAAKASYGRYYYILSTGGGGVSNVNPNSNYFATYGWNDANGDLKFQSGEQTGTPVITSGTTTTIDPSFRRPHTDEYAVGIDRELMANFKLSAVYTYRRERDLQTSLNPDNPYAATPTSAIDPGFDGLVGTGDDNPYQFFQRTSAVNRTVITNDPNVVQSYKGLEVTVTKRLSNRWQMLAGYTRSKTLVDDYSVDVSPNYLINANGNVTADGRCWSCTAASTDRPNQFKLTGMYILPFYDIVLSGNFRSQNGPPVTRQISQRLAFGANQTINLEPLGAHRLDMLNTLDVRIGKLFRIGGRELDADVDFDNVTNANTVWQIRTLTPATSFLDPTTGTRTTLPQFLAPTAVLGPRTIVFRASLRF